MVAILIAEDEPRISAFVRKGLSTNGFTVMVASDSASTYANARTGRFDLMVLDVDRPGLAALTVLRRLRADGWSLPVIALVARSNAAGKAAALAAGADDCVPKPFRFDDLLDRIRQRLATAGRAAAPSTLSYGGLRLDLRTRRAHVGNYSVDLSAREFALAETFLRHRGMVLSREQLLRQVWGDDHEPGSNVVDVYVRYLRRKLGLRRFVTVRGRGYRLDAVD
jgi:DNA-binding response OmpR family regulator